MVEKTITEMTALDTIMRQIQQRHETIFSLKGYWDEVIKRFSEICFLGEIDKDVVYVSMLHQIMNCNDGFIKTISIEEANEFYITNRIRLFDDWRTYAWTFWRFNLNTKYVSVFTSYSGDKMKSPKENYAACHEHFCDYEKYQLVYEADIRNLQEEDNKVFEELFYLFNYSRYNEVTTNYFNKKVFKNMSTYFGRINDKNFIDDEYKHERQPEIIRLPQTFSRIRIENEKELINKYFEKGINFYEINYEKNAYKKDFSNSKELMNYMYSLIDYVNKNAERFELIQSIESLTKYWESNKWPIPGDIESINDKFTDDDKRNDDWKTDLEYNQELKATRKERTLYRIAITRFDSKIFFRAAVREFGVCYYITNE